MLSYHALSSQPAALDLDFLINDLRFPGADASVKKTLGYLLHYLPFIKQEHNLRLVLSAFFNSSVCFGNLPIASFNDAYLIIEVFSLIVDKKLKVSQPSIPVKTWYSTVTQELENFYNFLPTSNGWKVLPIIAGMQLSQKLRDELYTAANPLQYRWFFQDIDKRLTSLFKHGLNSGLLSEIIPPQVASLSLVSLAIFYKADRDSLGAYLLLLSKGAASPQTIVCRLTDLILAALSENLDLGFFVLNEYSSVYFQDPVVKHLNRLTLLLESYLKQLPVSLRDDCASYVVDSLLDFNRLLNHKAQLRPLFNRPISHPTTADTKQFVDAYWLALKNILFSEIIVFQGVFTAFLKSKPGPALNRMYESLALRVLQNLYYLNFILLSVGTGGFDSYNFVYYLAFDIALGSSAGLESTSSTMMGDYRELNLALVHHDYLMRSKALFALGIWENYLQQLKPTNIAFVESMILPVCIDLVDVKKLQIHPSEIDRDVTEAAHSVLLAKFAAKKSLTEKEISEYIRLAIDQFPVLLSSHQLSIAVETLGKYTLINPSVSSGMRENTADEFLEFFHYKCSSTRSGVPIEAGDSLISSAQPVLKVDANSTVLHADDKDLGTDVIDSNKPPSDGTYQPITDALPKLGGSGYEPVVRLTPQTTREAMVFSFINLIPYLPLSIFLHWLNRTWDLVEFSNPSEAEFLERILWRVISENLDLNRCEMAYVWWYEEKKIPQRYTQGQNRDTARSVL